MARSLVRGIGLAGKAIGGLALVCALAACPSTDALYGRAYMHYTKREEAEALRLLAQIIEKDSRYTAAYVLESVIYQARGDWTGAEKALRAAGDKAPGSPVVSFNLGNVLFKAGEFRKAAAEYSKALAVNPAFAEAFLNRANAWMKLAEYKKALDDYEQFLDLSGEKHENVQALTKLLRQELGVAPVDLPR
jgi:protein O-GlcNAc transferase